MKLKPRQRWLILGFLLMTTLLAGYFAEDEPENVHKKQRPVRAASSSVAGKPSNQPALAVPALQAPVPQGIPPDRLEIDPFRNKSWYVAPPPPPPPKPKAPPLPFQYLGKVVEEGRAKVFLARQGQHLIVHEGDVVDDNYTVLQIAGGQMVIEYRPLQEKQSLAIGSAQ
ncbi:hypothetical protein AB6Q56_17985 [Dechloromonas sp. ARDL1]|uniref:hypothetical protein n=1 Tax=Dechloromonas sp. ARDL1 TaxID=3322121 RepID=UPI003DA7651F